MTNTTHNPFTGRCNSCDKNTTYQGACVNPPCESYCHRNSLEWKANLFSCLSLAIKEAQAKRIICKKRIADLTCQYGQLLQPRFDFADAYAALDATLDSFLPDALAT